MPDLEHIFLSHVVTLAEKYGVGGKRDFVNAFYLGKQLNQFVQFRPDQGFTTGKTYFLNTQPGCCLNHLVYFLVAKNVIVR